MTVTILVGDVHAMLATLADESVNCVVTSPPYWSLRDYGVAGQLGLEPTPQEHVAAMVAVFRDVRRVLRKDGVCWVNYGDSYAGSVNGRSAADTKAAGSDDRTFRDKPINNATGGLKPKDLCGVPFRFALGMQEDGWWWRSCLPWVKRNGMPESITDRPATAVEYVFMFTRSARYWYDAAAVRRELAEASVGRLAQDIEAQAGSARANGGRKTNGTMKAVGGNKQAQGHRRYAGFNARWDAKEARAREVPPRHAQYESSDQSGLDDVERGTRNFRNADLFFESLEGPHGLLTDGEGAPLALDVAPQPFSDWTETVHQERVEPDAHADGKKHTVSRDCPVHGDSAAQASMPSDDGRVVSGLLGSGRSDGHLVPAQPVDCAPIDRSLEPMNAGQSSDCLPPERSSSAKPRNKRNRKTALSPETIPSCSVSAQTSRDTLGTPASLETSDSAGRTPASRSEMAAKVEDLEAHTVVRNDHNSALDAQSCTCEWYVEKISKTSHFATFPPKLIEPLIKSACPKGGTILDCFGGAGTSAMVADRLGRNAILIEINPNYAEIARTRLKKDGGMFMDVA